MATNKNKVFTLKPNKDELQIADEIKKKLGIKTDAQLLRTGLYKLKEIFLP